METPEEKNVVTPKKCGCPCHKVPGLFIVLIGVAILLSALGVVSGKTGGITVGVLVILFGLNKMCSGMCKCCSQS